MPADNNPHLIATSPPAPLCAHPNQLLTSGQRPRLFGCRRDLMRGTSEECTLPIIRNWQTTPLAAPRQRLIHTNPRAAACAISTTQDYHPKSGRTPLPGSDQRPSPQARSSAHNSNRLWGAHAAARAGASQALRTPDLPARACSSLRLAVISLPNSMVARTLFIK